VGLPFFRKWNRLQRWQVLDGYALGLALGLAIGRIGCYSVGEHFGRTSAFFLAVRYDGGSVREPSLGDVPLTRGTTFHNTALYELLYMLLLFAVLAGLVWAARRRGREVAPATLCGTFIVYYGVVRWLSDSLRVNDERILGMTGAQWMCLVMIPAGLYILWHVRPSLVAELEAKEAAAAEAGAGDEVGDEVASGDEAEPATVVDEADGADSSAGGADDTTVDGASDDHEETVPPTDR
jgi:prolipoprotein diacylglyceryltransferase